MQSNPPRQPTAVSEELGDAEHPGGEPRFLVAMRYLLLTGALVALVGIAGRLLAWPLVTSTVGPTAYVFAAHSKSDTSRFRNAVLGHSVAVGTGLGFLFLFGLAHHPPPSATAAPSWAQVAAAAIAAGLTVAVLELIKTHHAPAAATALLIATGTVKPGPQLIGLVLGLAVVIAVGPALGRISFTRRDGDSGERARGAPEIGEA